MLGQSCPAPLQKNLEQWASGQPLSEIRIGRYSIPMIMAIWGQPDFSGALDVLTEYLTGDRDVWIAVAWTRDGEAGGVTTDVRLSNNHAAIHIIA